MDHAIESLKSYLWAEIDSYHDGYTTKKELQVYVKAINTMENYYFGEAQTHLDILI